MKAPQCPGLPDCILCDIACPQDCNELPHLIVVPLSTMRNWERELSVWTPYFNVVTISGNEASRKAIIDHEFYVPDDSPKGNKLPLQERVKFHVLLTSYEMVGKVLYEIVKLTFGVMVVDEGHRLKNKGKLFQVGSLSRHVCQL